MEAKTVQLCVGCRIALGKRLNRQAVLHCAGEGCEKELFIHSACVHRVLNNPSTALCTCKSEWKYLYDSFQPRRTRASIKVEDLHKAELTFNKVKAEAREQRERQVISALVQRMQQELDAIAEKRNLGYHHHSYGFHDAWFQPYPEKEDEYRQLQKQIKEKILADQPSHIREQCRNVFCL